MFSALSALFNATWSLPLSFLPSITLPANIQRRFLSFVLKRFLGRFIKGGGLDVERIQAQIGEGKVDIRGLELDTEEVNALIPPSLPFIVTSGTLSSISARLPFPNLWSAPLSISLDDLTIHLRLTPPRSSSPGIDKGKKAARPELGLRSLSTPLDLASSVTTAADEFLHEELDAYEEAELDRSIRQSLVLSQTDPFINTDDVPGAFPGVPSGGAPNSPGSPLPANVESTTVLAGLIERVLARLEFKVSRVKVRITHDDPKFGAVFELRIGEIRYADETTSAGGEEKRATSSVRVVRVSRVNLYMFPPPATSTASSSRTAPPPFFNPTNRSSSASSTASASSSKNTSSDDGNDDMMMSMAVADLRQSVADTVSSGASVYQSALTEAPVEQELETSDSEPDRSTTPTPKSPPARRAVPLELDPKYANENLVLSLGSEDIVLRMTTTQATPSSMGSLPASPSTSGRPSAMSLDRSPSVTFELAIGTVASILLPSQVVSVLSAMQVVTGTPPGSPAPSDTAGKSNILSPRFTAIISIRHVLSVVVYDLRAVPETVLQDHAAQFWAKPLMTDLPVGHLRFRLEEIAAMYRSGDPRVGAESAQAARTKTPRRVSTSTKSVPPSVSISLLDASIFEYLASATSPDDDSPPGGCFPVLIFDTNLPKQYMHNSVGAATGQSPGSTVFPEFDGIDWRNAGLQRRGPAGEKVWKVPQRGRGALKGTMDAAGDVGGPVVSVRKELVAGSPAQVDVSPLHAFLDLSLLERLLPMLRLIAPAAKHTDRPAVHVPFGRPSMPPRKSESSVLDDLDARAGLPASRSKAETAVIRCPMIRISIRCPAPVNRRGTWGDGAHLRSGLVTLDLHDFRARIPDSGGVSGKPVRPGASEVGPKIEWSQTFLFFSRVPSTKSGAFLVIGPLAPEPGEIEPVVICPSVSITSTIHPKTEAKTTNVVCRIPSIQAKILQHTIEGLQFFADDLTHWLDGAFGDGSRPKPRDELKMIGSRFFGSKGSSSVSSSVIEDDDDASLSATVIRLLVTETDVKLHVPRSGQMIGATNDRVLVLKASDMSAEVYSNLDGRKETAVLLIAMDADFCDTSGSSRRILGRTTPMTLTAQNHPIAQLRFSSLTDQVTETKETSIKAALSSFTFYVTADLSWIEDLRAFAKTPEGVFEDVVPSEVTRISLEVYEGSVHLSPPTLPGALVVVLGSLDFKADIVSDADDSIMEIALERAGVLAVDNVGNTTDLVASGAGSIDIWKAAGFAQMMDLVHLDMEIWRGLVGAQGISVDVSTCKIVVSACADSLASLGPLTSDLAKLVPQKLELAEPVRSPHALDQSINVFASVDEDAFNRVPDMISGADLIEDNLPTNLDYLDHAARRTSITADKFTGETLRTWQTPDEGASPDIPDVNGETVKILYTEPLVLQEDYWDRLAPASLTEIEGTAQGKIRVRVHDCSVNVLLYEGYDWQRTRKVIEDEIKAVRKRLEKIRQLLASGQQADESIENTQSVLFNSVYIGLDQSREMDPAALLAAIEELGDDTSSISSWQTDFPSGQPVPRGRTQTKKTRLRGKRLTRPKRPQIEFNLQGVKCEVDQFAPDKPTAMRLHAEVGSMEILDHIKTSTWKKFLTEMKADSRGNVRETDANMVRVELTGVRPSLPNLDEEYRLKAKILPLRLHVDQDALDFLKRFFSFSAQASGSKTRTAPAKDSAQEPFFQHVEIFPIELKLDYKPKRVDFNALREGRTIELMNFFHFDGAEMTLRHITLSGISGLTRLSAILQDIWTPDVKANQLADVISGVSPIRSMVNVGSGVADLILLPIEQYRKDGRVARGVQRGTNSFVKSTALEMMKLGARLATGTQVILEKAEGVLGGKIGDKEMIGEVSSQGPTFEGDGSSEDEREVVSRYAKQPSGAKEGVQAAYKSLSKNVNAAAQTILAVPMEVYERSGDDGPLKAVVRAVPIAVLKPMIGASEAVSKTLLGMRNSLDPAGKEELDDKYK